MDNARDLQCPLPRKPFAHRKIEPSHKYNQERMMKLAAVNTSDGRVIRIEADERLDLSVHGVFVHACKLAEYPNLRAIEVNLGKTRHIRDSGLAMLLMLREGAGHFDKTIKLFNCSPEIRNRLQESRVLTGFQIG
jgi:hypothetical protein